MAYIIPKTLITRIDFSFLIVLNSYNKTTQKNNNATKPKIIIYITPNTYTKNQAHKEALTQ